MRLVAGLPKGDIERDSQNISSNWPPTKEELARLMRMLSYAQVAELFGVKVEDVIALEWEYSGTIKGNVTGIHHRPHQTGGQLRMFIRRALTLVVAILWLWPASLHAQSDALMAAYRQGNALYEAGQYEQAVPFHQKALEFSEEEFGSDHPTTSIFLNNLAALYQAQGRYAEAEPLYKRALGIRVEALGREHPDVATSLNNLAVLYKTQGRYTDAEPLYKRALAIKEKALGPEHPDVAAILANYASLLRRTGRSAEADRLEARAKAIRAKRAGE